LHPDLERLGARLTAWDAPEADQVGELAAARQAAVAMILRRVEAGPEVLLMRRAERSDDRWSGQISLPGGHVEDHDADLRAAAMREVHEEVGVDLERSGRVLGRLALVQAKARGRTLAMGITPFVFALTEEVRPAPGPEAQEVFWFPLARAGAGELDDVYRYRRPDGLIRRLPSWRHEDRVVWGLTHEMLTILLGLLGDPRAPS
jgi:8-oxo-dGTP pyrophosphatase MutT (NUDIX family)